MILKYQQGGFIDYLYSLPEKERNAAAYDAVTQGRIPASLRDVILNENVGQWYARANDPSTSAEDKQMYKTRLDSLDNKVQTYQGPVATPQGADGQSPHRYGAIPANAANPTATPQAVNEHYYGAIPQNAAATPAQAQDPNAHFYGAIPRNATVPATQPLNEHYYGAIPQNADSTTPASYEFDHYYGGIPRNADQTPPYEFDHYYGGIPRVASPVGPPPAQGQAEAAARVAEEAEAQAEAQTQAEEEAAASAAGPTFDEAFAKHRAAGDTRFEYQGKIYNTDTAEDVEARKYAGIGAGITPLPLDLNVSSLDRTLLTRPPQEEQEFEGILRGRERRQENKRLRQERRAGNKEGRERSGKRNRAFRQEKRARNKTARQEKRASNKAGRQEDRATRKKLRNYEDPYSLIK